MPASPAEAGMDMFTRAKVQPAPHMRSSTARPMSEVSDAHDTEFEDDSELGDDESTRSYGDSVSGATLI